MIRLRDRVRQLDRHRLGVDPATMPVLRTAGRRSADGRFSNDTGSADGCDRGVDVDPALGGSAEVKAHVTVLGNVGVHGLGDLTRQQQALVCYLALHPGAGREAIVQALWDGRAISESRFLNLMAETRAVLGPGRLPPARRGRYSVIGLAVDAELLTEAGRRADQARLADDPDRERRWLHRGLSLISGPLLRPPGPRYWTWLDDDYDIVAGIESSIVAQSTRLAELASTFGDGPAHDIETAAWAYRRCLLAMPHHDEVAQALVGLYRRAGRHSAARSLERSLRRLH